MRAAITREGFPERATPPIVAPPVSAKRRGMPRFGQPMARARQPAVLVGAERIGDALTRTCRKGEHVA
jgi:hypothetical protein